MRKVAKKSATILEQAQSILDLPGAASGGHNPPRMLRPWRYALLLCGFALAPLGAEPAGAETGSDWPRFLGPTAKNTSPETGLAAAWPESGPPVVWSIEIGAGYSAPSVRGELLVVHHRVGGEEIVEALNRSTGQTVWRHRYPSEFRDPFGYNNGPRCTPLLTEDHCYTFGAEGTLVCLELESGRHVWTRETGTDWTIPQAFFGVGSSPLLEGDTLAVMVGGQPNAGMVGFDPGTGKTLWESVGSNNWHGVSARGWPGEPPVVWRNHWKQSSYATPVAATVHGERRIFALLRQGLVALNPQNGGVDLTYWFRSRLEDSVNAANPVVVDDLVFISGAYLKVGSVLLRVLPNNSLEEVWRSTVLEIHWNTPVYHQGFLYAFSGRDEPDARFRCVEFKTGQLKWDRDESWGKYSSKQPPVYGRGSAILADNKLIVLGEGGLLGMFAIDPEKPVELARWQVPDLHYPCWAGPILSHKMLYLRSENRLICLDLRKPPPAEAN